MAFLGENAGLSSRERGVLEEVYLRPRLQRVKALPRNTSDLELMWISVQATLQVHQPSVISPSVLNAVTLTYQEASQRERHAQSQAGEDKGEIKINREPHNYCWLFVFIWASVQEAWTCFRSIADSRGLSCQLLHNAPVFSSASVIWSPQSKSPNVEPWRRTSDAS